MKRKTSKVIAFTATTIVIVNLITFLIVQNMNDIEMQSESSGSGMWSLVTFLSVLALVMYLLSLCFENSSQ